MPARPVCACTRSVASMYWNRLADGLIPLALPAGPLSRKCLSDADECPDPRRAVFAAVGDQIETAMQVQPGHRNFHQTPAFERFAECDARHAADEPAGRDHAL